MNIDSVRELAELMTVYGLTDVNISEGDTRIRLSRQAPFIKNATATPVIHTEDGLEPEPIPAKDVIKRSTDCDRLYEVKSPMIGIFYSSLSPNDEPFTCIGSKVKKGDVLCVIETMKQINEIISEHDGEIAKIYIRNGEIAEFGQVLFKLR